MSASWIALQIGAREHYAIPRALQHGSYLAELITDLWLPPGSVLASTQRLRDRWHPELVDAVVRAANRRNLLTEGLLALRGRRSSWGGIMGRNEAFQRYAVGRLRQVERHSSLSTLFAYSYAARKPFLQARDFGWQTVLGQIDPGPEEERIVAAERRRYHDIATAWQPAPTSYWHQWHMELELSDRVLINSAWSRHCLLKAGVPDHKLAILPLIYETPPTSQPGTRLREADEPFQLLFLGTIGLRKGVARLLEAMRLLEGLPIQLTLAGPTEIDPVAWRDRPNIRWIGAIPRSSVGTAFAAADAFILPTLSDGFAITQLEALAHGCPVIASTNCGEVVKPGCNGWLLNDLEPPAIAACVREACATAHFLPRPLPLPAFTMEHLIAALPQLVELR